MNQIFTVEQHRVIDGDTIEVTLKLPPPVLFNAGCRIPNLDCPERWTPEGKWLRAFLVEFLKDKDLKCRYIGDDKYSGRFVGDILIGDGPWLSAFLLLNNLALPWPPGEKKPVWTNSDLALFRHRLAVLFYDYGIK